MSSQVPGGAAPRLPGRAVPSALLFFFFVDWNILRKVHFSHSADLLDIFLVAGSFNLVI